MTNIGTQHNPTVFCSAERGPSQNVSMGQFENRTLAYQAAREAMTIFNKHVTSGKARTLSGFKQKDFKLYVFHDDQLFLEPESEFQQSEI